MSAPKISTELESGVRVLNSAISNLKTTVSKAGRGGDEKTVSVISRIVELLEKTASTLLTLSGYIGSLSGDMSVLAPYTYVFRAQDEVVLLRTRPEHVVISISGSKSEVTIKTRKGELRVTPSNVGLRARGVSVELDLRDFDSIRNSRSEVSAILGVFEETLYRRVIPHFERLTKKR